jgi:hypothetical protein
MTWYAYRCAAGPNHRFIPDENVAGFQPGAGQPAAAPEGVMSRRSGERRVGGVYAYYSDLASGHLGG